MTTATHRLSSLESGTCMCCKRIIPMPECHLTQTIKQQYRRERNRSLGRVERSRQRDKTYYTVIVLCFCSRYVSSIVDCTTGPAVAGAVSKVALEETAAQEIEGPEAGDRPPSEL